MSKRYYISDCLQTICGMLGDVSKNVFPDHRPEAKGKQMEDMVVVSLPVTIDDQRVQQSTTIRFELIVRNKATGVANIPKLQEMLDALSAKFPMTTKRYSVFKPYVALKGNDGLGFTIWNVQARLIMFTTDYLLNEE